VRQARIKTDAVAFGDEGDEVEAKPKGTAKKKARYSVKVASDAKGEEVWHTQFSAKLDSHVVTKTEHNLIQLLLQPNLPRQFGGHKNPLCEVFRYNELKQAVVYAKRPPWARVKVSDRAYVNKEVQAQDITELRSFIQTRYELPFSQPAADSSILAAAHRIPFHPARDYCETLEWDGEDRLETWLIHSGGADDTPYVRAVSKRVLIGLCARIYKPGCKMDNILILEGDQGIGKSTLLGIIGGEWYSEPEIKIGDKDAEQNLQCSVLVEWSEFAHGYRELEAFKAWCTKRSNRFRGSYGKSAKDWPRTCIIVITMNPDGDGCYLIDRTGNRRMWPIKLRENVKFDWLTENRDQLLAEASAYYKSGEQWHLTREEEALAAKETNDRMVVDPWEEDIRDYITKGDGKTERSLTASQIARDVFNIETQKNDMRPSRRIGSILRKLGWTYNTVWENNRRFKAFQRPFGE
jgi:predicted P-loop ATPase